MNAASSRFWTSLSAWLMLLIASPLVAQVTLQLPAEVPMGAAFEVTWTGEAAGRMDVTQPDGEKLTSSASYTYLRPGSPAKLTAPLDPGEYGVKLVNKGETLALATFKVTTVTATVSTPKSVEMNESFTVEWTGPAYPKSLISVGSAEGEVLRGGSYTYAANAKGATVNLKAPIEPGKYTVIFSVSGRVLASTPLQVGGTAASLTGPSEVQAGGELTVFWEGPDNPGDIVSFVPAGQESATGRISYTYTGNSTGNGVRLTAPEELGSYEAVYTTGSKILARLPVEVVPVSATLEAPAEIMSRLDFGVKWTGPGNQRDRIIMAPAASEDSDTWRYLDPQEPIAVFKAGEEGAYELTYVTGAGKILATRPITVTPAPKDPGMLEVVFNPSAGLGEGSAVEVILDASGSMLQRQDGQRRIDIAKSTLISLVTETIPEGTGFVLRVFGHREADSCRTDLELPLGPLVPDYVANIISEIEAKNLAKTPIAASLALVESDMKDVTGERVVILLTDGEETCEGDPGVAIQGLRASGVDVRVNIVGYAIDDLALQQTFESWATLGGGRYLNAPTAEELAAAMQEALALPYEVYLQEQLVAQGISGESAHQLPPGTYELRFRRGGELLTREVQVVSEEKVVVTIP